MISRFHISDRNIVGLLMFLNTGEEFISMDMLKINNYGQVMEAAIRLKEAGLITSERSPDRRNKVVWKLTPLGKTVANHLHCAERELRLALGPSLKEGPGQGKNRPKH